MRLTRANIKDLRSIRQLDVTIEDDITTFVGANEHGKSNILLALRLLSPAEKFDLKEYARIDNGGGQHNPSIKFTISLDSDDRKELLEKVQSKYPSGTQEIGDGTTGETPPKKSFKLKDIPETVDYTRSFKEDDTEQHVFNITDEDVKQAVYDFIKIEAENKIIFFDDFQDRLESIIPKESIINDEDDLIIKGLLKVAGLAGMEDKIFTDDRQAGVQLEKAPHKLTKAVTQAWFQGSTDEIQIMIRKDNLGANLMVNIEDKNTYVNFGARSRGFKWFLSFYLKYRAHHDGDLSDAIFLMDEPGLFLHPKGQKDLLSFLEKLGRKNQIIYSTHSPFMINRLHARRVRVVEKAPQKGTVINSKGFTANWRHLRTALGMVLSDSFYFADKTLLVEGPEDVIYVLSLLKFFIEKEKIEIDVNLLSVMDAGGASNMPAMARIVKDEDRPLIALMDSDSQKSLNRLKKCLDEKKEIKEIKSIHADAVTIQDLLPKKLFQDAVNAYIKKLYIDGLIVFVDGVTELPTYEVSNKSNLDKEVEQFVNKNFGEEEVSKVGIAREFEELLNETNKFDAGEFANARALIGWVISNLHLEIK